MLSDIAFEQIDGNFWYAAYGPFRVVMMKDSGYINATKLCSSGGKDYFKWSQNKVSQELIKEVSEKLNMARDSENKHTQIEELDFALLDTNLQIRWLVISPCKTVCTAKKTEIDKQISGTYCHPYLIPHIACWVSPHFAAMVSEVVNGYITHEYKCKLNAMQLQLEHPLDKRHAEKIMARSVTSTTRLAGIS